MIFSSIVFLFYFLPLAAAAYFLAPRTLKNAVLLVGSLVFYAWGEPKYVGLMLLTVVFGYGFGRLIEKNRDNKRGRSYCIASVMVSLSFLLFFKYTDFLIENINVLCQRKLPLLELALPIGISFYTFQIISYTMDVYRGEAAQKRLLDLAAYIVMFPQLIAGPIVRYTQIQAELSKRTHSFTLAASGIRRFVFGLSKKLLLADPLGELCRLFLESGEKSVLFCWLYAIAVSLQLYFDFSGYSDMAIGLGRVFGFHFAENFRYPMMADSITDFWRRWHISLGQWFRDYVYIPLGGSRRGKARQIFNLLLVWTLTGLWHGAAWNFVVWGLLFALLLTAEKLWLKERLKRHRMLSHLYVLFFILVSFVIFNGTSLSQAFAQLGGLFGVGGLPLVSREAVYYLRSFGVVLLLAAFGATPAPGALIAVLTRGSKSQKLVQLAEPLVLLALLLLGTAVLADGSFQPFLYFRF